MPPHPSDLGRPRPADVLHARRLAEHDARLQAALELTAWLQRQPPPLEVFLAMTGRELRRSDGMRALQRMTNVSDDPARCWTVEQGEVVAPDHPAVTLHPYVFEAVG